MAKYEFKIEIKPREATGEQPPADPSLEEIDGVITAALLAAFPDAAEIRVYDGNRPDRD